MRREPCAGCVGSSLLEFAIVIVVAGIVALVFLNRVSYYFEQAEKASMQRTAADLAWTLRIRVAELMLASRYDAIAALDGVNPVEALDFQIGNYEGSGPAGQERRVPPGRWYFNRDTRELVYFPNYDADFARPSGARARVAWRVVVVRDAAPPGARARATWARLELVQPYRWLEVSEAAPVLC